MSPVLFFRNNQTDLKMGAPLGGMYFPHETGVAYYSDNAFFASGINRGGNVQCALCAKPSLEALKKWVGKTFDDPNPQSSDYEPGTAYKRIHWPLACAGSFHRAIDQNKLTESLVALRIRLGEMETLFETIEPSATNLHSYGQRIRELLLLACMEVGSSCAAVLEANGYSANKPLKTTDYVKLLEPMMLDSYSLSLRSHPAFPSFAPFDGWSRSQPTKSLPWYDAIQQDKAQPGAESQRGNAPIRGAGGWCGSRHALRAVRLSARARICE